jgi:hypothetical protein
MSCRNLKYSTTLEYLNSEVTIMIASSLMIICLHNEDRSEDTYECGDEGLFSDE